MIEKTSGNAGTGFAIVCRAIGYPFIAVMSIGNTHQRAQMMRALGAEVVLVKKVSGSGAHGVSGEDLEAVERKAQELTRERDALLRSYRAAG